VLPDGTKVLFVGDVTADITQEELRSAFSVHGTVSKVELKDNFAYVYMTSGGTRAHDEMSGTCVGASRRRIRVEWARNIAHGRTEPTSPNRTLYVSDYDTHTTLEDLRAMFEPHGKIVRISPCKKFTFIEYEKLEDSVRAHDALQGTMVGTRTMTIQYALPDHRKASAPDAPASDSGAKTADAPADSVTA